MSVDYRRGLPLRGLREHLVGGVLWLLAAVVACVFAWILWDLLRQGAGGLSWRFLSTGASRSGREGGVLPMLVSTLAILVVCLVVSIPLGTGTAILLAEFTRGRGWFATLVGRSLDVLAAVPSIVFGLFGNVLFCRWLGLGYSLLAGGLTLGCMILPLLIRSIESGLRDLPDDYRQAAAALGMSKTRTILSVLLPNAVPGIVVGVVLGAARALSETAALLFTSGYVDRMPESLFDSGRTLSIHIYDLAMNVPGGEANAYTTALVLVGLLIGINLTAAWIAERWRHRSEA